MPIHNYKKLEIWKAGIELTDQVYEFATALPDKEKYGLWSQMTRSAVSIPSNIAEGSARKSGSFRHFLRTALGSAYELETQLIICNRRGYGNETDLKQLQAAIQREQKMIFNFLKHLPEDKAMDNGRPTS